MANKRDIDSGLSFPWFTRFRYLYFAGFVILFSAVVSCENESQSVPVVHEGLEDFINPDQHPFYHGIASGDPLQDAIIIWTRVTPDNGESVEVSWEVASDRDFENIVKSGSAYTSSAHDYTVKEDVRQLEPGTVYFYRFSAFGRTSTIGTCKTALAENPDKVRLAAISCINLEWGYFNGLRSLAGRRDVDAVLLLGDYIYEYAPGEYGDTTLGRKHIPQREIVTLDDYRTRYAQYRLDPDMQAFHAAQTVLAIWDDHEIADNAYRSGAKNHQDSLEGSYAERVKSAKQAFFEWLPVRLAPDEKLYRAFQFGEGVEVFMLDERLEGRPAPLSVPEQAVFDSSRTMLGAEQLQWLKRGLTSSSARWKVIGNQVLISDLNHPGKDPNLDRWVGYPAERKAILTFIEEENVANTVFLSGDTHRSWAVEVPLPGDVRVDNPVAVEVGVPSLNSANADEDQPVDEVIVLEQEYLADSMNVALRYVNLRDHGYVLMEFGTDTAIAEWWYSESVQWRSAKEIRGSRFCIPAKLNRFVTCGIN